MGEINWRELEYVVRCAKYTCGCQVNEIPRFFEDREEQHGYWDYDELGLSGCPVTLRPPNKCPKCARGELHTRWYMREGKEIEIHT